MLTPSALTLPLLLLAAGPASGFDLQGGISPDPKAFLHKYALLKLHESCFGQEAMYQMKLRAKDAARHCQAQPVSAAAALNQAHSDAPLPIDRSPFLQQFVAAAAGSGDPPAEGKPAVATAAKKRPAMQERKRLRPTYLASSPWAVAGVNSIPSSSPYFAPLYHQPALGFRSYQQHPRYRAFSSRGKRQMPLAAATPQHVEQLNQLKSDVLARLSNVTCALRRMGIADEDGGIDVEGIRDEYAAMPGLDPAMREEIRRGASTCAAFARCLPDDGGYGAAAGGLGGEIAPLLMFVNCFKGKKLEACIKKDLRERLAGFVGSAAAGEGLEADDLLAAREGSAAADPLESSQDMETFLFAMLYEDESKDLFS